MSVAVVPIKGLADAKSRLLPELSRAQLEALSLAMLRDVVAALRAVPSLDAVTVVTPDERVAEEARAAGARVLLRTEPGLNDAIDAGAAFAARDDEAVLTVLGDVAGARADEIEQLFVRLRELDGRGAVLAPSADGGSSALLRAPRDIFPSRFGKESAKAHREAAAAAGAPFAEVVLPSLAVDLDCAADLRRFLADTDAAEREAAGDDTAGRHTRALLRELGW